MIVLVLVLYVCLYLHHPHVQVSNTTVATIVRAIIAMYFGLCQKQSKSKNSLAQHAKCEELANVQSLLANVHMSLWLVARSVLWGLLVVFPLELLYQRFGLLQVLLQRSQSLGCRFEHLLHIFHCGVVCAISVIDESCHWLHVVLLHFIGCLHGSFHDGWDAASLWTCQDALFLDLLEEILH